MHEMPPEANIQENRQWLPVGKMFVNISKIETHILRGITAPIFQIYFELFDPYTENKYCLQFENWKYKDEENLFALEATSQNSPNRYNKPEEPNTAKNVFRHHW